MKQNVLCLTIGVGLLAISFFSLAQSKIGPPMPPVPPLPSVAIITNGAKVFRVTVAETPVVATADMPAALPVSENAPHHYYGIVELKPAKDGIEGANEVLHLGLHPNDETFRRSHGVGNAKFNSKYKAVIKYPSELPLDLLCVWQRREGFGP